VIVSLIYLILNRADTLSGKTIIANREKELKNLEPGFPVLREAVTAVYRAAFGWLEGNFTFLSAV